MKVKNLLEGATENQKKEAFKHGVEITKSLKPDEIIELLTKKLSKISTKETGLNKDGESVLIGGMEKEPSEDPGARRREYGIHERDMGRRNSLSELGRTTTATDIAAGVQRRQNLNLPITATEAECIAAEERAFLLTSIRNAFIGAGGSIVVGIGMHTYTYNPMLFYAVTGIAAIYIVGLEGTLHLMDML